MKFVSFHTHSTYSYADGFGTVQQHVERVRELGMSAMALSEHGNVNSHAALERECEKAGIKPIFGLEAYFGPTGDKGTQAKTHLTIFAMNQTGYHNLNRIVTQSYIDSYYFPTVSPTTLKKYNEGILVLSGCSDSLISCSLLGGKFLGEKREPIEGNVDWGKASGKLQWFLDVFGPDRFFLEVQRFPKLGRTCALNAAFAELGEKHGIGLVATADVHYPHPSDNKMQAVLHNARWKSSPDFLKETAWEYQANLSYPESDNEIISDLVATGLTETQARKSVEQTAILASACTVELPKAKPLRFKTPNNRDAAGHLKLKVIEGWNHRVSQRPDLADRKLDYFTRIKEELAVITPKDFSDYFLATADLVQYGKSQDVTVGPGRGSAAGSVVCYVLGITEIDPLHPTFSRMVFERFIDPTRSDMPDIDLDFDDELRYKIPERARVVYGAENVANVANHVGYRSKNTLANIATAYQLPFKVFDPIAKRASARVETDERVDDSIADAIESYASLPEIAALVDKYPLQLSQAIALEGNEHSMGIHAGGFVISSEPIPEVCAIYTKSKGQGRKKETVQVLPYEKRDAEHLGMLKMDFLGLTTMGMCGLVRKWIGMSLDELYALYYNAPEYEHERILEQFQADDITGVFQYEGGTTRQVVRDVRPDNFDELAACNALSRPGPLYGGQTKAYISVKRGEMEWERIHEHGFDRHVEWTYGQIVYQEQIMWILRDLAGFSTERVLRVRKIIGKKLGEFQFAELWEEFRTGCNRNGVSNDNAAKVWSGITTAAGYAFNTAHAYSYALVAWWQAYFKIHHPVEFYAATLAKNGDGKDDLPRRTAVLQDMLNHKITVGEFDPDVMGAQWQPVPAEAGTTRAVMPGWCQIPEVGEATAYDIVAWRAKRNEKVEWWHLTQVKGISDKTVLKMVEFIAVEDALGITKTKKQLDLFRKQMVNGEFATSPLPSYDNFCGSNELTGEETRYVGWVGFAQNILFRDEIEQIRQRTGKTVEAAQAYLATKGAPDKTKKATIFAYDEHGELSLRISRWKYDNLQDRINAIQTDFHIIVVWGRAFSDRAGAIQVEDLWVLDPD